MSVIKPEDGSVYIQNQTYIEGNRTPSESVASSYGVRTCGAYCVVADGTGVKVYFRFFLRCFGTVNSTLQSALCSGTWGEGMAGRYLGGTADTTWYYGTTAGDGQYDAVQSIARDGSDFKRENKVGWYGGSGATYQSTGTMFYGAPHSVTYSACDEKDGTKNLPGTQTKYYNVALKLSSQTPTRDGYTFKGWSTSKNATVADSKYDPGASYTDNKKLVLYPVWQEHCLTVNYYSNYATEAFKGALSAVSAKTNVKVLSQNFYYSKGYSYGLANYSGSSGACHLIRTGYSATKYWGTTTSGGTLVHEDTSFATGQALAKKFDKDLVSGNQSVNVYPQWRVNTYTITYDANGGTGAPSAQTKTYGTGLTLSATKPTRTGYTFEGWSTDKSATEKTYSAGGTYAANSAATLYAVWSVNSYYLDVNGSIDGSTRTNTSECGTFDVYVGGVAKATGVTDFYQEINYGTSYEIKNIKSLVGHTYTGVSKGSLTGTMGTSALTTVLAFKTNTITLNYRSNYATEAFSGALNKVSADSDVLVKAETYKAVCHSWEGARLESVAKYSGSSDSCYLARTGYNPQGVWCTRKSQGAGASSVAEGLEFASGRELAAALGESCDTDSVSVSLYPLWAAKGQWFVSYSANGGTDAPATQQGYVGSGIMLSTATPTRAGYRFLGWSTSGTSTAVEYHPGDTIPSPLTGSSIVLYAVWQPLSVSVRISSAWRYASAVWAYGSDGAPKKALSVTVYDSDGLPHTSPL